jgi:hypothetical protein
LGPQAIRNLRDGTQVRIWWAGLPPDVHTITHVGPHVTVLERTADFHALCDALWSPEDEQAGIKLPPAWVELT